MKEDNALKALLARSAGLILVGIGYEDGLVGGYPCPQNTIPRDATLVPAGIVLASITTEAGYRAGSKTWS